MTTREICERIFAVINLIDFSHDYILRAGLNVVQPYTMAKEMLQNLMLDIASSETEKEAEEEMKYIVRCDADVGNACMFCSFWNGKCFVKGEENAKTFNRRESAEEELNRFGYSPSDYSILTIQTKTTE